MFLINPGRVSTTAGLLSHLRFTLESQEPNTRAGPLVRHGSQGSLFYWSLFTLTGALVKRPKQSPWSGMGPMVVSRCSWVTPHTCRALKTRFLKLTQQSPWSRVGSIAVSWILWVAFHTGMVLEMLLEKLTPEQSPWSGMGSHSGLLLFMGDSSHLQGLRTHFLKLTEQSP